MILCLSLICPISVSSWAATDGELEINVIDKETQKPVAVRMHLKDARGKPVVPPKAVSWKDHFVFDGQVRLKLSPGSYQYEIERGPEYRTSSGKFTIEKNAEDRQTVEVERFINMSQHGWWSGELHVHRPLADIELLMRAEDLHVAPVITWWNNKTELPMPPPPEKLLVQFDQDRFYHLLAGEDEREGGALLFFNLTKPLAIKGLAREYPSGTKFLHEASEQPDAHVDVEKPFWWDMPVWVATGKVDSIGLANNHLYRDGGYHNEAWGKPRDKTFYPDPQGNGRWSQDIYYHLLNCGLRIPPSAGSASGVLANPVGYNRVYVHCNGDLTWEKWWQGLRDGQVVVTNGPLLRARVNQQLPGHLFTAPANGKLELQASVDLSLRDKVDYLEIIKDGQVAHEVRLADYVKAQGKLPAVIFDRSGWMLIRAVTNHDKSYRFASTGPFYVSIGEQPQVSRKSARFFLEWVIERAGQIKIDNPDQQMAVMEYHRAAREYWQDLVNRANGP
jgi:hypothetical protein